MAILVGRSSRWGKWIGNSRNVWEHFIDAMVKDDALFQNDSVWSIVSEEMVAVLDEQGNPVLDEKGEPTYRTPVRLYGVEWLRSGHPTYGDHPFYEALRLPAHRLRLLRRVGQ